MPCSLMTFETVLRTGRLDTKLIEVVRAAAPANDVSLLGEWLQRLVEKEVLTTLHRSDSKSVKIPDEEEKQSPTDTFSNEERP
jgi:hypothetical protein